MLQWPIIFNSNISADDIGKCTVNNSLVLLKKVINTSFHTPQKVNGTLSDPRSKI